MSDAYTRGVADARRVKPLIWHKAMDGDHKAESFAGTYIIYANGQGDWTLDDGWGVSAHSSVDDAKRAGDREETHRILSSLIDL